MADARRAELEALERRYVREHGRALAGLVEVNGLTIRLPWPMTRMGSLTYLTVLAVTGVAVTFGLAGPVGVLLSMVAGCAAAVGLAFILAAKPPLAD